MLGVFPLIVMFLITSITMQRERVSGTLERILTTPPLRKLDLLAAYGTAFSIAAAAQATLACVVSFWFLGLDTAGNPGWVILIAIVNAVLGVGLGLLCSAFARTEFQAVQFMPLVIAPPNCCSAESSFRAPNSPPTGCSGSATRCPPATLLRHCSRSVRTRS